MITPRSLVLSFCWLILALSVSVVESFSFLSFISVADSTISSAANDLLTEVVTAEIPKDLDGIRECRKSLLMQRTAAGLSLSSQQRRRPLLNSEKSFLNATAVARRRRDVQCVIARENFFPFRVLGTVDVRINAKTGDAFVCNVFVREEARGRGIAQKMMTHVEELLVDSTTSSQGNKKLTLTVNTQNEAALKVYRRCGYTSPGVHVLVAEMAKRTGANAMVRMSKKVRSQVA